MYIAISGNIGSGKSCLAQMIGERLGWEIHTDTDQNPYIEDFYEDMRRWSMNLQVYFLGKRLDQISHIISNGQHAIIDRTIYEDAEIFALNLHRSGLLTSRDYQSYITLYDFTARHLPLPDLLIYLRASTPTLVSQIQRRGRPYETAIDQQYLGHLSSLYESWIATYPGKLLIVDVDKEDFVTDPEVKEDILKRVENQITK